MLRLLLPTNLFMLYVFYIVLTDVLFNRPRTSALSRLCGAVLVFIIVHVAVDITVQTDRNVKYINK